jgi:hypothetical protein
MITNSAERTTMSKRNLFLVSKLLIVASLLIKFLVSNTNSGIDSELIGFFAGILFGAGSVLFVQYLLGKKVHF